MRTVSLVKHSNDWKKLFVKEEVVLKLIISENYVASYHIGSTAILGIRAKPVIDLLFEVKSIIEIDQKNDYFQSIGYEVKGEHGIRRRRFFQKGIEQRTHHLHIYEAGDSEIERHRIFVEFMNAHQNKSTAYERLKIELSSKYKDDSINYSRAKSDFIETMDAEAIKWKLG